MKNLDRVSFVEIITEELLVLHSEAEVAEWLELDEEEVAAWDSFVPMPFSQYIRETQYGKYPIIRRVMRATRAIAVCEGLSVVARLTGTLERDLMNQGIWLTETQSLHIEYATRGKLKGTPIQEH